MKMAAFPHFSIFIHTLARCRRIDDCHPGANGSILAMPFGQHGSLSAFAYYRGANTVFPIIGRGLLVDDCATRIQKHCGRLQYDLRRYFLWRIAQSPPFTAIVRALMRVSRGLFPPPKPMPEPTMLIAG